MLNKLFYNNLYKNIDKYEVAGKRQGHFTKTNFSYEKMAEVLKTIIDKKFTSVPVLKLPVLKKI